MSIGDAQLLLDWIKQHRIARLEGLDAVSIFRDRGKVESIAAGYSACSRLVADGLLVPSPLNGQHRGASHLYHYWVHEKAYQ